MSESRICCQALTASCMACAKGISIREFCSKNPGYMGCPSVDDLGRAKDKLVIKVIAWFAFIFMIFITSAISLCRQISKRKKNPIAISLLAIIALITGIYLWMYAW